MIHRLQHWRQAFLLAGLSVCLPWFIACQPAKEGGPCDYKITRALAEIDSAYPDPEAPGNYLVLVTFPDSLMDGAPQYLHELLNTPTDTAFIKRNKLYIGNKYYTTVSEIRPGSGDCTPRFVSFDTRFRSE